MEKTTSQTNCHFFKLPAELRNSIYSLVFSVTLTERGSVVIGPQLEDSDTPSVLCLLQTCQAIRDEAQGLFYSTYNLEVYTVHASDFIQQLGLDRLKAIRTITLYAYNIESFILGLKALWRAVGMRVLVLHLHDEGLDHWQREIDREMPFILKAARKLPATLTEISVHGTRDPHPYHLLHNASVMAYLECTQKLETKLNSALQRQRSPKNVAKLER